MSRLKVDLDEVNTSSPINKHNRKRSMLGCQWKATSWTRSSKSDDDLITRKDDGGEDRPMALRGRVSDEAWDLGRSKEMTTPRRQQCHGSTGRSSRTQERCKGGVG